MLTQLPPQRKAAPTHNRRGSALLIVMVLMAMLSLLGVLFYLFATQERLSAEYYSNAAKVEEYDFTIDQQMDFALEQIIVGPKLGTRRNSALYGGRHSIIPNMLGITLGPNNPGDLHPFNGRGVDPTDPSDDLFNFNDSPLAQGEDTDTRLDRNAPQPDVDYTYPDINSVFLSYDGPDEDGFRIIIPSFHRPQYLDGALDWYSNPLYSRRVMRPHVEHRYSSNLQRYLTSSVGGVGPFPLAPPNDVSGDNSQRGEQGIWTNSFNSTTGNWVYEYDVDNDGDGILEGVWLDLDFPPLEDESGQLYVPLVSATVKDVDALLNLNVHGNLARVWNGSIPLQSEFAHDDSGPSLPVSERYARQNLFVSRSNLGLTPAEVNPLWAINRQPNIEGSYTAEEFFANTAPNRNFESANREWLFLLMGRFRQLPTTDLISGRFGEEWLLPNAATNIPGRLASLFYQWPGPGQTDVDDNSDAQQVSGGYYGQGFIPFGRPLDYSGLGSFTTFGKYALVGPASPSNLGRWPRFDSYSTLASVQPVWSSYGNGMTSSVADALSNDLMETVFDARSANPSDDLFGPDEMRLLHLNNADFVAATGGGSRVSRLAPFNFGVSDNTFTASGIYQGDRSSQQHRGKFTTLSWDRKQFNPPPFENGGDPLSRASWEYNADADQDGYREFPPSFPVGSEYSSTDPFRPLLRKLLEVEPRTYDQQRLQLRLSINELLTDENGNPLPGFDPSRRPPNLTVSSRPLTNHNTAAVDGTAITGPYPYPPNGAFSSARAQEWWARRDRQLMAKDIYVLLYSLCFGEDDSSSPIVPKNPTAVLASAEDDRMKQRMAQFAVNIVDSLDRDNIITTFEYDNNLSNGWTINDDPYDDDGGDRQVVRGVERLDLTLSEVLALRAQAGASDEPRTEWIDDDGPHHFAYVELQNPGPASVRLSDGWRVVVVGDSSTIADRELELRDSSVLQPGERYTIASIGQPATATSPLPSATHPSILKVAPTSSVPSGDWGQEPTTWIAPGPNRVPDLELQLPAHASLFALNSGDALLDESNAPPDANSGPVRFRLERLAYPGIAHDTIQNPWVPVDFIEQDSDLALADFYDLPFDAGSLTMTLDEIKSTEREQPFGHLEKLFDETSMNYPPPSSTVRNSLVSENSISPAISQGFNIFQGTLDRDFASVIEFFQLGTVGGEQSAKDTAAERYFLNPAGDPAPREPEDILPNRWHRLLEFVEVPTRTHRGIPGFANALDYPRVPGKININMIRHPEVLAALIDDPTVMRVLFMDDFNQNGSLETAGAVATPPNLPNPPFDEDRDSDGNIDVYATPPLLRIDTTYNMNGSSGEGLENWWIRFLRARDGRRISSVGDEPRRNVTPLREPNSPFNVTKRFHLPGTPFSNPFRSWGWIEAFGSPPVSASAEGTLVRSWPGDFSNSDPFAASPLQAHPNAFSPPSNAPNPAANIKLNQRHLFELGTFADHSSQLTNPTLAVDPTVRNRILAKIANNVTTRSNVFVIYLSLKYFKAVENNGAIQIGEPLDTSVPVSTPDHRGFFVIDRTRAEDAWDPATQRFDFRSVIQFRQVLQ